jgi:hypothetical protein
MARNLIFGATSRWMARWFRPKYRAALPPSVARALLIWIALLVVSAPLYVGADEGVASEAQMKAAFLVNFPKYVEWPASAFAQPNSPVVVAIFGDDKVINEFNQMIQGGRSIEGRQIVVKRISTEEEITSDCHILYVGASERQHIGGVLERIKGKSVLTVSEAENFLDKGGIINLMRKEQNLRLGVNLGAAGQARLRISSNLLSVADVVKGKPN